MARIVRIAALALILAATLGGVISGTRDAAAANGYEQWVDMGDGCINYWDGYTYSWSGCSRADGGFDFYLNSYGQWIYVFTTVPSVEGGLWIFYGGTWYYDSPNLGSSGSWYPDMSIIGGGTWGSSTGNVLIDQIFTDSNDRIIDNILSPNCIEIVAGVCYY